MELKLAPKKGIWRIAGIVVMALFAMVLFAVSRPAPALAVESGAGVSAAPGVTAAATGERPTTQGLPSLAEVPAWAAGKSVQFVPFPGTVDPPLPEASAAQPTYVPAGAGTKNAGPNYEPAGATKKASAAKPLSLPAENKRPIRWNGGPVQHRTHVFIIFWGKNWNQHEEERNHMLALFRYINNSPFSGILTQYFDGSGYISGEVELSSYTDQTVAAPEIITEKKIEREVAASIKSQGWVAPNADTDYLVMSAPESTYEPEFQRGCGDHAIDEENGSSILFVGYETGTGKPVSEGGKGLIEGNYGACREGEAPIYESEQDTAAHEWVEAHTDPVTHLAHPASKSGWARPEEYENMLADESLVDACAGAKKVEVATEIFVPRVYDDYLAAKTNEQQLCVATDKEPVRYTVQTGPVSLTEPHVATVSGSVTPALYPAAYRFHVTGPGGYSQYAPSSFISVGSGEHTVPVSGTVTGLSGGQHYVVTLESFSELTESQFNGETSYVFATTEFEEPEPPRLVTAPAEEIGTNRAALTGSVNPHGSPTTYYFAWGTSYGSLTSRTPEASAGLGRASIPVRQFITGLEPGHEYFFQLVAANAGGTSSGSIGHLVTPKK